MKVALWANVVWAAVVLLSLTSVHLHRISAGGFVVVAVAAIYLGVSALAIRQNRWAIVAVVAVPLLMATWWDSIVLINSWMYFSGHELYRDSPATIFIVLIYAILFAIPASVLSVLFYLKRREVIHVLRPRGWV